MRDSSCTSVPEGICKSVPTAGGFAPAELLGANPAPPAEPPRDRRRPRHARQTSRPRAAAPPPLYKLILKQLITFPPQKRLRADACPSNRRTAALPIHFPSGTSLVFPGQRTCSRLHRGNHSPPAERSSAPAVPAPRGLNPQCHKPLRQLFIFLLHPL